MILYIDESLDENYFVVGGFLSKNDYSVTEANKRFRKHSKSFPMKEQERRKIFTEFKSTCIDDSYPALKKDMLKHICSIDCTIVYDFYCLNGRRILQEEKERIYIQLLGNIIASVEGDIAVYFDSFKKKDFEDRIKNCISKFNNVILIDNKDSLNNKGIQFADNLCSVIRRHLSNIDDNNYYDIIKDNIKR